MLGLTPAVWITEATVPSADAVSSKPVDGLPVGDVAVDGGAVMPRSSSAAAAASSRSCLTSQRTTGWSRPTIFAVASPMPPAPPVMTET